MKHLKAYTFEELLCEIPELEKKDVELNQLITPLKRFCRENNLKYSDTVTTIGFDSITHFLFEKLNSPISISNYNSL